MKCIIWRPVEITLEQLPSTGSVATATNHTTVAFLKGWYENLGRFFPSPSSPCLETAEATVQAITGR
eukprot:scaffold2264_cov70-Cylindrotheca_fusiformis.AAC.1